MTVADPPSGRTVLGRLAFVVVLVTGFVGYAIGQGLPGGAEGLTILGAVTIRTRGLLVAIASIAVAVVILGVLYGAVTLAARRSETPGPEDGE